MVRLNKNNELVIEKGKYFWVVTVLLIIVIFLGYFIFYDTPNYVCDLRVTQCQIGCNYYETMLYANNNYLLNKSNVTSIEDIEFVREHCEWWCSFWCENGKYKK